MKLIIQVISETNHTRLFYEILFYISSKLSSIDTQPPENSSPQEVPSSPILKRARNTFSDLNPPFYTEDNHTTYQVSIDHDWEEAPVDIAVPKVTVKRIRKPNPSFTDINTEHQVGVILDVWLVVTLFNGRTYFKVKVSIYNSSMKQS